MNGLILSWLFESRLSGYYRGVYLILMISIIGYYFFLLVLCFHIYSLDYSSWYFNIWRFFSFCYYCLLFVLFWLFSGLGSRRIHPVVQKAPRWRGGCRFHQAVYLPTLNSQWSYLSCFHVYYLDYSSWYFNIWCFFSLCYYCLLFVLFWLFSANIIAIIVIIAIIYSYPKQHSNVSYCSVLWFYQLTYIRRHNC